jgi:hypothetical protein
MDLAAVGAFFSGVGAVLSALVSLRIARKRAEERCAQRIEEIRAAIHEGYRLRDEK